MKSVIFASILLSIFFCGCTQRAPTSRYTPIGSQGLVLDTWTGEIWSAELGNHQWVRLIGSIEEARRQLARSDELREELRRQIEQEDKKQSQK